MWARWMIFVHCVRRGEWATSVTQRACTVLYRSQRGVAIPAVIHHFRIIRSLAGWAHSQRRVGVNITIPLHLPDITGRTALAVRPDVVNAKYHVITNATYNRDPVPAKFKHVTNIDTCTLLCCDYSTLWEALHVNMLEIGARFSDENVKILVSYQWIGWKRRTKMVGE